MTMHKAIETGSVLTRKDCVGKRRDPAGHRTCQFGRERQYDRGFVGQSALRQIIALTHLG